MQTTTIMKKNLFKYFVFLLGISFSSSLLAQVNIVSAGKIDILNGTTDVNFADATCQCDTIVVEYEIKPNANFPTNSTFEYQLATNPNPNWANATNLELTLLRKNDPPVALTLPSDTFSSGKKWASLVMPCNTPIGIYAFRIINRNSNGTITPIDGFSDTTYRQVNRIPVIGAIDSVATIRAGVKIDTVDNPYSTAQDLGTCSEDSIYIRVNTDATAIQWFNGANLLTGETKDSLKVGPGSGAYYAELTNNGNCPIYSDTVIVSPINTPTTISFDAGSAANANAYRVDNPIPTNFSPRDSIELCESDIALLQGPLAPINLTFTYQWLTDSFNNVTGQRDWYALTTPTATQRFLQINTNSSVRGWNHYRVVVNDGFCQDTTPILNQFWVNIDSVPNAQVVGIPFPGFTGPTVFNEICMKDSVNLSALPAQFWPDDVRYRWQWYDATAPAGQEWKSVSGQPVGNLSFDTLPSLAVDTSLSDPGQPYFQSPKPELRYFRLRISRRTTFTGIETCVFFTDSVAVRWFPDFDITPSMAPGRFIIGQDSINFCETDSTILTAPSTPAQLLSAGNNQYVYSYQWLSDSIDPINGGRVKYPLVGETNQSLVVRETGRWFVVINDGICSDTSDVYRTFVDTVPQTSVVEVPFPGRGLTNLNLCLYDSALISATDTVLGLLPWDYQWYQWNPNGANWALLQTDTNPTLVIDTTYSISGFDTLYFQLRTGYENRFGNRTCDFIADSVMVVFYEPPTLSFFPGDSVGLCPGDSILFVAQGNFNQVTWTASQIGGATRYINTPGDYPVEAVGVNGCITRDTVTVYPLIVNAAAGPDQTIESGEVATLTGMGGTNYRWFANKPIEFSDFLSQTIQVSKVLEAGVTSDTVWIYVEVTNTRGCVGIDSLRLIINRTLPGDVGEISKAYNIFTPNNDGLNDVWDIRELMDGDACSLVIMNRWGSVVFEDDNFPGTWTGVDNGGNELPDGTYYYVLDCGGTVRMQNAVTIIRNQQ